MAAKKIPNAMMAQVQLETGDLSRLKAALLKKNGAEFQKGEVWQAILNLGYAKWQSMSKRSDWDYGDMIEWVGLEYGPFAQVCILLGKYNQQVLCNGHAGYWDNGYAGGQPGAPDEDHSLHKKMLALMRSIGIDQLPAGKKIYDVAVRFEYVEWRSDYHTEGLDDEQTMKDDTVDDDYADAAQYKGKWERDFNAVVQHVIDQA